MLSMQPLLPIASEVAPRVFASLQAKYTVVASTTDGHSPEIHSCVTRSISNSRIVFQASDAPPIGAHILLIITTLGAWPARISEHLPNGFAAVLEVRASESAKLARRLNWLKRLQNHQTKGRRAHQRLFLPPLAVKLLIPDGTLIPATLFDLSCSGVGVNAASRLPAGSPLVINGISGRVARRFNDGMGIRFDVVYPLDEVKRKLLTRSTN